MPREIEHFDGTRWTTTKVAPTRNAPFAGLGRVEGTSWTTTRVAPTRNAPFAGCVTLPSRGLGAVVETTPGTLPGVRWRVLLYGNKVPTAAEISAIVVPFLKEQGFETVGKPKLVVDPNVVWSIKQEKLASGGWQFDAAVGAGPFKGLPGGVAVAYTPPPYEEMSGGISVIAQWSVNTRVATLEDVQAVRQRAQAASRTRSPKGAEFRLALAQTVGSRWAPYGDNDGPNAASPALNTKIVPVSKGGDGGGAAVGMAAIIGLALMMSSLGAGRQ